MKYMYCDLIYMPCQVLIMITNYAIICFVLVFIFIYMAVAIQCMNVINYFTALKINLNTQT